MRKTFLLYLLTYLFCALNFLTTVNASSFVTHNDRPDRSWIASFKDARTIIVKDSIEQALKQCPAKGYCDLQINQLTLSKSININRSKVRLSGVTGNRIRMADTPGANGFFFRIGKGVSEIIFTNLNLDGENQIRSPDIFGVGTYNSNISHVLISNNRFTSFHGRDNAHAIAFYGTGADDRSAIHNIIIENNHVSDMRTGSSESIVVNGNVRQWEIIGNTIRDINNIAIDAIGGEGTAPVQTLANGRIVPGEFDKARYGFIERNTVVDMSTINNPAYGNKMSWAGAIYIDGAHSIRVSDNTVSNVPWGLVVGAENCMTSSFVQIYQNKSSLTHYGDVLIGGYSKGGFLDEPEINCNPHTTLDVNEGHGYVSRLDIRNNELNSDKTGSPDFIGNTVLQYRIDNSTIEPPYVRFNQ